MSLLNRGDSAAALLKVLPPKIILENGNFSKPTSGPTLDSGQVPPPGHALARPFAKFQARKIPGDSASARGPAGERGTELPAGSEHLGGATQRGRSRSSTRLLTTGKPRSLPPLPSRGISGATRAGAAVTEDLVIITGLREQSITCKGW